MICRALARKCFVLREKIKKQGLQVRSRNAPDWTVSSGEFYHKPVVVISASPSPTGGDKAHTSLLLTLTALGANVPEGGKLMIPAVGKKLTANGGISERETRQGLRSVLDALAQAIKANC